MSLTNLARRGASAVAGAVVAIATLASTLTARDAAAQPITYTFSGDATGTLDGTSFVSAPFTVTIGADISNLNPDFLGTGNAGIENLDGMITLGGFGTLKFTSPLFVYVLNFGPKLGFGESDTNTDLLSVGIPTFSSHYLTTTNGPIVEPGGGALITFVDIPTSHGLLTLQQTGDITFNAVAGGVSAVPEPSTYGLLAAGLIALGGVARRRRTDA